MDYFLTYALKFLVRFQIKLLTIQISYLRSNDNMEKNRSYVFKTQTIYSLKVEQSILKLFLVLLISCDLLN